MEYRGSLRCPWPEFAPPQEAVHLRQSYDTLRALLLPLEPQECLQNANHFFSLAKGTHTGDPLWGRSFASSLSFQRAPRLLSKSFPSKQNTITPDPGGLKGIPSRPPLRNMGIEGAGGQYPDALRFPSCGAPSPPSATWEPIEDETPVIANTSKEERVHNCSSNSSDNSKETASTQRSHRSPCIPSKSRAHRRANSSEGLRVPPMWASLGGPLGREELSWVPPEAESFVLRQEHRGYSNRKTIPLSLHRWRERVGTSAASVRGSSSGAGEPCKCEKKRFSDDRTARGLRAEALERVRQRAREARKKQKQQQLLEQQLQKQQHERSQLLSQKLMQMTLQRIREKSMKREEQRQQQQLVQQQQLQQAEEQRQYCARHRKLLQQRLLQKQQEIKNRIRTHAEESVRQSLDAKARKEDRLVASNKEQKDLMKYPGIPCLFPSLNPCVSLPCVMRVRLFLSLFLSVFSVPFRALSLAFFYLSLYLSLPASCFLLPFPLRHLYIL